MCSPKSGGTTCSCAALICLLFPVIDLVRESEIIAARMRQDGAPMTSLVAESI